MMIKAVGYYLSLCLIFISETMQQTTYNQCNIEHCMACDSTTQLCTQCEANFYFQKEQLLCIEDAVCPIGQYKTDKNSICQDCFQTCKSCYGPGGQNCYECIDGYIFVQDFYSGGNYNCMSCSIDNCESCYSQDECSTCQDGYLLNKVTGKCDQCKVTSCQECNKDISICDQCFTSYQLQTTSNATATAATCVLKGDCIKGTFKDSNGNCTQSCDASCQHCYGSGDGKCYQCSSGYFLDLDSSRCLKCGPSCQTCISQANYCTSCIAQLQLNGSKCLSSCNTGEFNNNGKCNPCPAFCLVCTDSNTCTSCIDPSQYIISQGKCVGICGSGKYNQLSGINLNYWKSYQFSKISSTPNCLSCNQNCQECTVSSNTCTLCSNGLVLSNSKCVQQCKSNEYLDYDPYLNIKRCIPCQYPCNTCNDRFSCQSCLSDSVLKDGKCYYSGYVLTSCDEGQVNFNGLCMDSCPVGSILEGDQCTCDFTCNTCFLNVTTMLTECILCNNQNLYSSSGVCAANCPANLYQTVEYFQTDFYSFAYNGCVDKCPPNTLSQVSSSSRQCVKNCSSGYTLYQNTMCLNLICSSGTYFDSTAYQNLINTQGDLTNQSLYCFACDSSCAICSGKLNTNCIKCTDSYVEQKRSANGITSTYCLSQCDTGYMLTKWQQVDNSYLLTCTVCLQQCTSCLANYYSIQSSLLNSTIQNQSVFDCFNSCPLGTVADPNKKVCNIQTTINVYFDYTNSIENKFCIQSNINVILVISSIVKFTADPISQCSLVELQLPLSMKNQGSGTYSKYAAVIPANTLNEGQTYNVKCSVNIQNQNYYDTEQFNTFKLIHGNFAVSKNYNSSLDSTQGYAVNDTFSFSISSFSLDSIDNDNYVLQYKLDAEMTTVTKPFSNITIFSTDSLFYRNYPNLSKNFQYTFNYSFPQILSSQSVKIYLTVFGASTLQYTVFKQIQLSPYDQQENLKVVSSVLQNALNSINAQDYSQLTLTQLKKFSNTLMAINLVPYLDVGQQTEIAKEKMLSNLPAIANLISCSPQNDCSSQGDCKQNITSYYAKCNCYDGFSGETCSWKTVDLNLVQTIYSNALDIINTDLANISSGSSLDSLSSAIDLLNSMASIRDIFSTKIANKFFQVINNDELYSFNQDSLNSLDELLQINDYSLDILRKLSSQQQVTSAQINQVKQNFIKSLNLQATQLQAGQEQKFSLTNVNGVLKDLSYSQYGQNYNVQMQGDLTQQWSVTIPTSQLGQSGSQQYSQVIIWPSDLEEMNHDYSQTLFSLAASNIIDITIRDKNNPNNEFLIQDATNPIYITLNRQIKDSDLTNYLGKYSLNCTYQLQNGTWTSDGLQQVDLGNNNIQCLSTHLTNFALRIQSYNSDLFNVSAKQDEKNDDFNSAAFLVVNFLVVIILGHVWALLVQRKINFIKKAHMQQVAGQIQQNIDQQLQRDNNNNRQPVDSIFNNPSPFMVGNQQFDNKELKLGGIHVAGNDEPKMIEGLPIYQNEESLNNKKKEKKPENINKLQINQIDFNNVNTLQENPEKFDKIAQNIARRAKEAEIDMCNADHKQEKCQQNREVNLIPISTFYHSVNQNSPSPSVFNQQGHNEQDHINQHPFTLEISPDLPQGVPIVEEESVKQPNEVQQQPLPFINDKVYQHKTDMISQHPLYSFTRSLVSVKSPIRILLFFQIFSLYEELSIGVLIDGNDSSIQTLNIGRIIQIFFQVMVMKAIMQYFIPLFIYLVSLAERFCFSSSKCSNSPILKYICIMVFTIFSLIAFTSDTSKLNSLTDFSKFLLVFAINFICDYFILGLIVIKMQQCCNSTFLHRLIKQKNLDITY